MTRRLRIFCQSIAFSMPLAMAVIAWGQANQPLQVGDPAGGSQTEPAAAVAKSPSQSTSSGDDLTDLARRLAGQADAASSAAPRVAPQPTGPDVGRSSSTSQAGDDSAPASSAPASSTAARPPLHSNEHRPLGVPMSSSGQASQQDTSAAPTSSMGWGVTQTLVALGFVVALLLIGKQVVMRWTGRPAAVNSSRVVEVLSRVSVGPRQQVVLLRMGGRILVVADSAGQMRPLANLDDPEEVAAILKDVTAAKPTSISQGFGQLLGRFDQDYDRVESHQRHDEGSDHAEHQTDRARDQLSGLLSKVRSMSGKGGRPT